GQPAPPWHGGDGGADPVRAEPAGALHRPAAVGGHQGRPPSQVRGGAAGAVRHADDRRRQRGRRRRRRGVGRRGAGSRPGAHALPARQRGGVKGGIRMAADRTPPTLADYVVTALSPALIMALVGSLVFFLLEVLYVGQYTSQLQWGLFFFVFAAVLIGRISIQGDTRSRAGLYTVALAIPVWLTLQFYVEYPEDSPLVQWKWAINLALMGLTWWAAHKLTWDCTFIDEEAEDAGEGLLDAAGLRK